MIIIAELLGRAPAEVDQEVTRFHISGVGVPFNLLELSLFPFLLLAKLLEPFFLLLLLVLFLTAFALFLLLAAKLSTLFTLLLKRSVALLSLLNLDLGPLEPQDVADKTLLYLVFDHLRVKTFLCLTFLGFNFSDLKFDLILFVRNLLELLLMAHF